MLLSDIDPTSQPHHTSIAFQSYPIPTLVIRVDVITASIAPHNPLCKPWSSKVLSCIHCSHFESIGSAYKCVSDHAKGRCALSTNKCLFGTCSGPRSYTSRGRCSCGHCPTLNTHTFRHHTAGVRWCHLNNHKCKGQRSVCVSPSRHAASQTLLTGPLPKNRCPGSSRRLCSRTHRVQTAAMCF